jgi:hypothetical protein
MEWRRRTLRLSAGEGDDHAVMEICHWNFLIFCSWVNLRSSCSLISSLVKATAPLSVHSPVDHETWRLLGSALLDVPCSTLHNGAIDCATAALSDICGLCLNRYASNPAQTHTRLCSSRALFSSSSSAAPLTPRAALNPPSWTYPLSGCPTPCHAPSQAKPPQFAALPQ